MNAMERVRSILGHSWAALCLVVVLATFVGLGSWSKALANATGIRVSPWFSGGEVARAIDHDHYRTLIREPVFEGLFGKRSEGFVQIDWVPEDGKSLPEVIQEELDVDGNGSLDLRVRVESASGVTRLTPIQTWVLEPQKLVFAGKERILRIRLRNPG